MHAHINYATTADSPEAGVVIGGLGTTGAAVVATGAGTVGGLGGAGLTAGTPLVSGVVADGIGNVAASHVSCSIVKGGSGLDGPVDEVWGPLLPPILVSGGRLAVLSLLEVMLSLLTRLSKNSILTKASSSYTATFRCFVPDYS